MDPLTGAVCNPPEIWQMVDEMLVAQEQWLPQYTAAVKQAKENLSKGNLRQTFILPYSYTDLADFLSVDRSAMMRELKLLIDEGFIEKNGSKITLLY